MLPTTIRATPDLPSDDKWWMRVLTAAWNTSGGSLAPVIISQAQRLPEETLAVAVRIAKDLSVALCLTMVASA